jgi:hypothetical protein
MVLRYDRGMIRTRNFFLFILTLAFLVGGILLTLWFSASSGVQGEYADMIFGGSDTATRTAEVVTPEDKRESRLAALRAKLAKYTDVAMAPSNDVPPVAEGVDTSVGTTSDTVVVSQVDQCANYRAVVIPVLTGGLTYGESGGQRTFAMVETTEPTGSTSLPIVTNKTVFTLPLRTASLGMSSCVGSDVVAVTPTGLPIRNADYAKYRGLGEATLVGYTIDGFELYGQSSSLATDECGGASVSGTYRYYLSSEREAILNCFAAIPVAL